MNNLNLLHYIYYIYSFALCNFSTQLRSIPDTRAIIRPWQILCFRSQEIVAIFSQEFVDKSTSRNWLFSTFHLSLASVLSLHLANSNSSKPCFCLPLLYLFFVLPSKLERAATLITPNSSHGFKTERYSQCWPTFGPWTYRGNRNSRATMSSQGFIKGDCGGA